jgi:hypothetical protein
MSDWFHSLPVAWMALLVFGFTYFVVAVIYVVLFATGVATAALLIAAHDRPFIGEISVSPDPLLQVMPQPEG